MPTRLELLLEAERRGILPPDKLALLQEARKRGLLPGEKPQEPEKEYAGFTGAFKEQVELIKKSPEALAYAANPTDENRIKFLQAAQSQYKSAGFGEDNWEAFKQLLGSSLGFMAVPAVAAFGGSLATPFVGAATGAATTFTQYEINALLRKAQADQEKIDAGKKPEELNLAKITGVAATETGLDLLQYKKFKYAMEAFPIVKNLLSSKAGTAAKATDQLVDAFRNGTLKSTGRGTLEGVAKGIAFEVPQELAQTALERWGADLEVNPFKDEGAFDEYVQTIVGAAVLGGPLGAIEGNIRTRSEAKEAKKLSDKQTADFQEKLQEVAGSPDVSGAGLPAADLDAFTRRPAIAQQAPKVLAKDAPLEARQEPANMSPKQVQDEITQMEAAQKRREAMLSDLDELKQRIESVGGNFETGLQSLTDNFEKTATRLDIFRSHLEGLSKPPEETPVTPMAPIPQTGAAQQTIQVDQAVAQGLGLPGAETAPKNQPFTVTTETSTPPVAPIPQIAGAQQALGLEGVAPPAVVPDTTITPPIAPIPQNAAGQPSLPIEPTETVADPLYEQAVNAVIRTGTPTIPTLQKELQISFNRAARLLERMQIEGVVTPKDKETGQRQITMGQRQEAPSATAETSQRVAEQTQLEPVGRGTVLPPSGAEPAGRVSPVTPVEGVEPAVSTAADVAPREGRVEPALGDLSGIGETRTVPISTDISGQVGTKRPTEAPPAAPVQGITETQQAVDIQTAEETVKGSTQTIVSSGSPPTVDEQNNSTSEFVNNFGNSLSDYKELTKERLEAIKDFLNISDINDNLRSFYYAFISLPQQVQLFAKELPSLRGLTNVILARNAALKNRKEEINKNYRIWASTITKYDRKTIKKFYRIGNESTRRQVDFKSTDPQQMKDSLRAEFYALPEDLQNVYFQMLDAYRKLSDEYINLISKVLSPTMANELRKQIETNRLKIYFPLYRDGEYLLRYEVPGKSGEGRETVVQFFNSSGARKRAWKEALANGAINGSEQFYSGTDEIFEKGEAGQFFTKVMEELKAQNAPPSVLDSLYKLYLDQLPASSVRQMYRKRNGYEGFESNMLNVYATVATRMATQLNNLNFNSDLDAALAQVDEEYKKFSAENKGNLAVKRLKENLNVRMDRIRNPTDSGFFNSVANFGGSLAYRFHILGNISTALTNLSQLGIAYAVLEGKYRGKAGGAIQEAISQYFKGGFDVDEGAQKLHFADWSFGIGLPVGSNLEKLYVTGVQQGAIRRSIGYEAIEGRKKRVSEKDYVGKMVRVDQILGWLFQNSERMNREVTLIAAFNLELQNNGGNVQEAIQYAIDETGNVHGSTVGDVAPTAFQNNFGRVAFIFKGFAQAQMFLQYKVLREVLKGETAEIKKTAAIQFLAISTMAFFIAGLQGMPLYGLYSVLAGLLEEYITGDPDNPRNPDYATRQAVGDASYDGFLSSITGIDFSSRAGFSNLLWRDDDKRVEEIGPILFAVEQVFGVSYGIIASMGRGIKDLKEGHLDRAAEAISPAAIRNILKAFRYSEDGLLNRRGEVIVENFNDWNIFMQAIGFGPLEVSQKQKAAGAAAQQKSAIEERRKIIMNKLYLNRLFKDKEGYAEALKERDKFNQSPLVKKMRRQITNEQINTSYASRRKQALNSVYGVHYSKKQRPAFEQFMLDQYEQKEETN